MKYLVTAEEMRRVDNFTIKEIGIPAMVLMERAALAAYEAAEKYFLEHPDAGKTALVMAGVGNNGGDGLALARLLSEAGYYTEVWVVGEEAKASEQWLLQRKILKHYPVGFCSKPGKDEYTILVDALFGVGLSREISGVFENAVEMFNELQGWRISLDMPSGVDSDTGRILGRESVRADETITFGFCKRGLCCIPAAWRQEKSQQPISEFPGQRLGAICRACLHGMRNLRSFCRSGVHGEIRALSGKCFWQREVLAWQERLCWRQGRHTGREQEW